MISLTIEEKVRYETFVWNQLWTAINKISKITNVLSVIKKKKKFLRIEAQKRARSNLLIIIMLRLSNLLLSWGFIILTNILSLTKSHN